MRIERGKRQPYSNKRMRRGYRVICKIIKGDDTSRVNSFGLHEEKIALETILIEQRKLEAMVIEHFENGRGNMGADTRILEQSSLLDQLVVDQMMLDEMSKDYPKEQKAQ